MIMVIGGTVTMVMITATIFLFSSVCLEYSPPVSPRGSLTHLLHIYTPVNASSQAFPDHPVQTGTRILQGPHPDVHFLAACLQLMFHHMSICVRPMVSHQIVSPCEVSDHTSELPWLTWGAQTLCSRGHQTSALRVCRQGGGAGLGTRGNTRQGDLHAGSCEGQEPVPGPHCLLQYSRANSFSVKRGY